MKFFWRIEISTVSISETKVWFVGAGPGDPELLTVKGQRLIRSADLVLYAGSLVPEKMTYDAKPGARIVDSSCMTLGETHALLRNTVRSGGMAVRLHTGDPSLYGAVREQAVLLDMENIPWDIVPGVSVAFAAAASAHVSFTVPETCQSLIITRLSGRTKVPEREQLRLLAAHRAALAIYLSAADVEGLQKELRLAGLEEEVVVIIAHQIGWKGECIKRSSIARLVEDARDMGITRQTVFLVLPGENGIKRNSRLYAEDFQHGFRSHPK